MKLLADMHISPRTVEFLRSLGHDVLSVDQVLKTNATDEAIVAKAIEENCAVLTQDLDFSAIIALTGKHVPSLICPRLSSSRVEYVNAMLRNALPLVEQDVKDGSIITVEDQQIRRRNLPIGNIH